MRRIVEDHAFMPVEFCLRYLLGYQEEYNSDDGFAKAMHVIGIAKL